MQASSLFAAFAGVERKDLALGANLIGALVGGLLQPVTFIIGIKGLLLIVAGLYTAAMLTRPAPAPMMAKRAVEEWAAG